MQRTTRLMFGLLTLAALTACSRGGDDALYTATEWVAMQLGQEYSLAMLLDKAGSDVAVESWMYVSDYATTLDVVEPDRYCTESIFVCMGLERDRLGVELGQRYGQRAQHLFEVMLDTGIAAAAYYSDQPEIAQAVCRHIETHAPLAQLPEEPWRELCAIPANAEFDAISNQVIASRDTLARWVIERIDFDAALPSETTALSSSLP